MATNAPPSPAPWYQSRTVWVLLGAVLSNVLAMLGALGVLHLSPEASTAVLGTWNSILAVLGIAFRWTASGPLSSGTSRRSSRLGPLVLALLLVLPLSTACAGLGGAGAAPATAAKLTPSQSLYKAYRVPLSTAAGLYEDALREAGALHARGAISDEQLEQMRKAGRTAGAALRLARSALAAYLAHSANASPSTELFTAQKAVAALLDLAHGLGLGGAP